MSPILVRPVREQLEHDRVIRLLQAKYKRKYDVGINPGTVQAAPVGTGPSPWYPDLVLYSTERGRKLQGVVEVETVESINHLEAMSQWGAFSRLKVPFTLYVPAGMVDVARRFCSDLQIAVTELWAYHAIGDQIRFTPIQRAPGSDDMSAPSTRGAARPKVPVPVKAAPVKVAAARAVTAKPVAVKPVAAKPLTVKPAPGKVGSERKALPASPKRPAKPVARVAAPVRKAVARPVKSSKPAQAKSRKPAPRPGKRK